MVRKRFIIFMLLVLSSMAFAQKDNIAKNIIFQASFLKDSAFFGETVRIKLYFKNTSDFVVPFSKDAKIGIVHYHPNVFIDYDTVERMLYSLNNTWSSSQTSKILPGQTFEMDFGILMKNSFFYKGENCLRLFYNYAESRKKTIIKKKNKESYSSPIFLWSDPVKIVIM
jgi:hypothetical protein